MTLRDFIEQEIENGNVLDIADFGTNINSLEWEDREEIPLDEFEDYLDYNLESVKIIHDFGTFYYSMRYEISLYYWEEE